MIRKSGGAAAIAVALLACGLGGQAVAAGVAPPASAQASPAAQPPMPPGPPGPPGTEATKPPEILAPRDQGSVITPPADTSRMPVIKPHVPSTMPVIRPGSGAGTNGTQVVPK
ncbi:hypothetical protein [Acidisoma sp. C75]